MLKRRHKRLHQMQCSTKFSLFRAVYHRATVQCRLKAMFMRKYGFFPHQRLRTLARQRKRATRLERLRILYVIVEQECALQGNFNLSVISPSYSCCFRNSSFPVLPQLDSEECETQRRRRMNLKSGILLSKYPSPVIREKEEGTD